MIAALRIDRRALLIAATLSVIAPLGLKICNAAEKTPDRPNVIFLLADDLGYGDLGCFGQKLIKTPHIDQLAAEGMRFTQAYAGSTVCAPARCSLMTGLHTGHSAIRGNKELPGEGQTPMPGDTFTIAQLMKQAGYATGLIGKWGLGYPGSESTPNKMGFDYFYGYNCQRQAHEYYPEYLWRNDDKVMLLGKEYSHDLMADEMLQFVKQHQEEPFFLYVAFTIPHSKLQVPELGEYEDKEWSDPEKKVAAMITRMDKDVGRLMSLLKELKLDDNTLVFFASDNGAAHNFKRFDHSGPLKGRKRSMYEGGIRSPSIARWPGHIPAGVVSEQIWSFWDMMPTLADLTQQKLKVETDGISFLPAMVENRVVEHPPLYWEFHEGGFSQGARIGDWKAVRTGVGKPIEIYDLTQDIGEERNLAAERPELVKQFAAYLDSARVDSDNWKVKAKPKR
ncbi:arylsulfatase [Blastopirellula sp. JC732]|uniref:Arylsulfatase n=1 Tax=Blastopirellula sediminis TaxID=2894196 RepID=A0A9X1SF61_9BACT|nr:arylsulfatase [Blastopirellula sediminis]MCC9607971.1 arylsulfatase [Blastopirellula sediminis]MCC9627236.1 arylsulfatase [Blastopirellula sediminis]